MLRVFDASRQPSDVVRRRQKRPDIVRPKGSSQGGEQTAGNQLLPDRRRFHYRRAGDASERSIGYFLIAEGSITHLAAASTVAPDRKKEGRPGRSPLPGIYSVDADAVRVDVASMRKPSPNGNERIAIWLFRFNGRWATAGTRARLRVWRGSSPDGRRWPRQWNGSPSGIRRNPLRHRSGSSDWRC